MTVGILESIRVPISALPANAPLVLRPGAERNASGAKEKQKRLGAPSRLWPQPWLADAGVQRPSQATAAGCKLLSLLYMDCRLAGK